MTRVARKTFRSPRVTINDVAAASGLSIATVSKVMNRPVSRLDVSAAARQRVLDAAGRLGYQASWRARAFASGRTHVIALMYPHNLPFFRSELWEEVFTAINDGLRRHAYDAQFVSAGDGHIDRCQQMLLEQRFDGVIAFSQLRREADHAIAKARLPAVLLNVEPREDYPCVMPDDRAGGQMLMRHLLALGHRHVAFATSKPGTRNHFSFQLREQGINDALAEAALPGALTVVSHSRDEIMDRVLQANPRPTAIIEYHSSSVLELLRACWLRGIEVPRQMSIATFNDTTATRQAVPAVTTLEMPSLEMATRSLEILLAALESPGEPPAPQRVVLPERLIVRESTVPPAQAS